MKVIIAGSISLTGYALVNEAVLESGFEITEVFSGAANGIDKSGERWASLNGISLRVFYAAWEKYGKRAGPIRNKQMVEEADVLIAIWDGVSPGTKNVIEEANKKGIPVFIKRVDK